MADEPNPTPDGGKTLSQEQVDKIVETRLAREREKYADYDELKKKVAQLSDLEAEKQKLQDEKKSESEKLAEQISALQRQVEEQTKRADEADAAALRAKVAQAKGLSETFAARLTGSTKEELEADADSILEAIGGKKDEEPEPTGFGRPKEKLRPGASSGDDEKIDSNKLADSILSDTFI